MEGREAMKRPVPLLVSLCTSFAGGFWVQYIAGGCGEGLHLGSLKAEALSWRGLAGGEGDSVGEHHLGRVRVGGRLHFEEALPCGVLKVARRLALRAGGQLRQGGWGGCREVLQSGERGRPHCGPGAAVEERRLSLWQRGPADKVRPAEVGPGEKLARVGSYFSGLVPAVAYPPRPLEAGRGGQGWRGGRP